MFHHQIGEVDVEISEAQQDIREVYHGGFHGQVVSGVIWLLAASAWVAVSPAAGIVSLLAGGVLIFPLTTLLVKLAGGPAALPGGHPMAGLAMQIAFTVPLGLLVAVAAAGYREEWFFPASMVIVGAHYLPFTFLYGMPCSPRSAACWRSAAWVWRCGRPARPASVVG